MLNIVTRARAAVRNFTVINMLSLRKSTAYFRAIPSETFVTPVGVLLVFNLAGCVRTFTVINLLIRIFTYIRTGTRDSFVASFYSLNFSTYAYRLNVFSRAICVFCVFWLLFTYSPFLDLAFD